VNFQWHLEMHQAKTSLKLQQSRTLHIGLCKPVNRGNAQHQKVHVLFSQSRNFLCAQYQLHLSLVVTVTEALVLRPLLEDRGRITESIRILVPIDRMKQKTSCWYGSSAISSNLVVSRKRKTILM